MTDGGQELQNAGRGEWEKHLLDADLQGSTKFVGLALATYANFYSGGRMFPGIARLVKQTGLSKSTVIRALKGLELGGYILCVAKAHSGGRGGGPGRATEYRLTLPLGTSVNEVSPEIPDSVKPDLPPDRNEVFPVTPQSDEDDATCPLNEVSSEPGYPLNEVSPTINEVSYGPKLGVTRDTPPVHKHPSINIPPIAVTDGLPGSESYEPEKPFGGVVTLSDKEDKPRPHKPRSDSNASPDLTAPAGKSQLASDVEALRARPAALQTRAACTKGRDAIMTQPRWNKAHQYDIKDQQTQQELAAMIEAEESVMQP